MVTEIEPLKGGEMPSPFLHTERTATFESLTLTKLKVRALVPFSGVIFRNVKIEEMTDLICDDIYLATADMFVAGKETIVEGLTHNIPVTWWDHLKKRFFPKLGFNTERITQSKTVYYVCPHMPMPTCSKDAHFAWLKASDQEVAP